MDVFTPTSLLYPYERAGGIAPVIVSDQENGTQKYRRQWLQGATELKLKFKGTKTNIDADMAFLEPLGGYTPFKFKDYYEYAVSNEPIGTGDSVATVFYFEQKYPDTSNMAVYVNSVLQTYTVDYVVSDELGKITFAVAPGVVPITATYEFYRKYFVKWASIKDLKLTELNYAQWSFDITLMESII